MATKGWTVLLTLEWLTRDAFFSINIVTVDNSTLNTHLAHSMTPHL